MTDCSDDNKRYEYLINLKEAYGTSQPESTICWETRIEIVSFKTMQLVQQEMLEFQEELNSLRGEQKKSFVITSYQLVSKNS